ncbi:hypothetical protein FA95DRAFT_1573132 [Auriscalpium vulgare]|uniref:Uncharacterized protein n=1 Tax=Auriscalpium vulgare TaxID=40419 RepID=A0ACB8RQH4_9AGAM|nr:hypothetical protein FA95DRAFT_1573132 [Auriscalpium vulgare]
MAALSDIFFSYLPGFRARSPSPSRPTLPVELLEHIVAEIPRESVQDLLRVRAASRTFCAIATPGAFRSVGVTNTKRSAESLKQLLSREHLAQHVEEVVYSDRAAQTGGRVEQRYFFRQEGHGKAIQEAFASAFTLLPSCPALHAIHLTFLPSYPTDTECNALSARQLSLQVHEPRDLHFAIVGALVANSRALAGRVTSLTMHNLLCQHNMIYAVTSFEALLHALHKLHIHTVESPLAAAAATSGGEFVSAFWQRTVHDIFLARAEALTDLTVCGYAHAPPSGLSFSPNTLPALRTLRLEHIDFELGQDFLRQHEGVLEELVVDGERVELAQQNDAPQA